MRGEPAAGKRLSLWARVALALLLVVLPLAGCSSALAPRVDTAPAAPPTVAPTPAVTQPPDLLFIATPTAREGLPTIPFDRLPSEARAVVRLLAAGGPFPYRQDGAMFQNRERLLPSQAAGYYREYTVETPGSADRGARRIVAGKQHEVYYTDDHYASFKRVVP